jgi:hypothetical protein
MVAYFTREEQLRKGRSWEMFQLQILIIGEILLGNTPPGVVDGFCSYFCMGPALYGPNLLMCLSMDFPA